MRKHHSSAKIPCYILFALFVLLGIGLGLFQMIRQGQSSRGLLGLGSLGFFLMPWFMGKLGYRHPYRMYCLVLAFSILAYDVGCVWQGFDRYPGLDKVSHFLSGIVFVILGFVLCFATNAHPQKEMGDNWLLSCCYALFFSSFVAVVWEICEFTGFLLTGHDSQHHLDTGVFDTMEDLIACIAGSFIGIASFLLTVKGKAKLLTGWVLEEFFHLDQQRRQAHTNPRQS